MVEDRGDVVGVAEPACGNQSRQQGIEVVAVGFGSAEFGCERAECVGWMARSASSVVKPEVRKRVAQWSCWVAAAMVSYSAASCAIELHWSCSAAMVLWAENSTPECCSTPQSTLRAVACAVSVVVPWVR